MSTYGRYSKEGSQEIELTWDKHQNEAASADEVVVNEIMEPSKIKTRLNYAATGMENTQTTAH